MKRLVDTSGHEYYQMIIDIMLFSQQILISTAFLQQQNICTFDLKLQDRININ